MARPERNSVDYFPFICKEGKAMFYMENKYGNDGFATWVKILRQLAFANYHYLDLSNKADLMFISSKCRVSEDVLVCIIDDLVELGEFDKYLWENKVIWSPKFIESIHDAYKKRNNECITYEGLNELLTSKGILKQPKGILKGYGNPQSKVNESKEEESKEEEIEISVFNFKNSLLELGVEDPQLSDWLKVRKTKRASNT